MNWALTGGGVKLRDAATAEVTGDTSSPRRGVAIADPGRYDSSAYAEVIFEDKNRQRGDKLHESCFVGLVSDGRARRWRYDSADGAWGLLARPHDQAPMCADGA